MFIKGDLILPIDRVKRQDWLNGLFHPAVVWNDHYNGIEDFEGIMLTKNPNYPDNIPMQPTHFVERVYEKGYNNSLFVNQLFIKFSSWGKFELVGKLTPEGVNFIEENLTNRSPLPFRTYYQQ